MVYVLDTSAILSGRFFGSDIVTTPKILDEIQPKGHSYRLLETMKSIGLQVILPPSTSRKLVEREAARSGDRVNLSDADIEVLALAHHLNATLLTDDYAMQNVAVSLGIAYEKVLEHGIKEHIQWMYACTSCGTVCERFFAACPECGGSVKRHRKR